jgi:hypothetical protein
VPRRERRREGRDDQVARWRMMAVAEEYIDWARSHDMVF